MALVLLERNFIIQKLSTKHLLFYLDLYYIPDPFERNLDFLLLQIEHLDNIIFLLLLD